MSQAQPQGLGGLSYKSTADLSGMVSDVSNGNAIGTTYKNGIGMAVIADANYANQVVLATNGDDLILGVLANNPKAGEAAQIQSVRGSSAKVLAGAAITAGDKLITDSSGRFITASGAAQLVCGIAMEAATGAGDLIEAVLVDSYVA